MDELVLMDLKAKESSWQAKATNMFKKGAGPLPTSSSYNQQENIKKYKNTVHRKIKIWWTKTTLENYVSQQIVPRGLRVHLFPTFNLDDESLKERWMKAANACSVEFMKIIIENNTNTLKSIETEIESLQRLLQQDLSGDSFQEMIGKLDKEIEKWEGVISHNKQKKYERDLADFETNRIFKWQINRTSTRKNVSRSSSIASGSSMSEGGDSTYSGYKGPKTRQFTKKGSAQGSHNYKGDHVKVINLSAHMLTTAQERVLQKGLNFSPSSHLDSFITIKDLHLFARKLVLKKLHYRNDLGGTMGDDGEQEALDALMALLEENSTDTSKFPVGLINKSNKFPPLTLVPAVDTFTKMVASEIEDMKSRPNQPHVNNLSREERVALGELKSWDDVVFKIADKGGNVVIWPNHMYEAQAKKLLSNSSEYKTLAYNPMIGFKEELIDILTNAVEANVIPKKLLDIYIKLHPRLATFYLVPKVHKNPEDPPGRPIVAANEGLCEIICNIVEYYLKPLVIQLPSYIRDTTAALGHLEGIQLNEDMILVTADVEALYSSIRHIDGLQAVGKYLSQSNIDNETSEFILELLRFILTHNAFMFAGKVYLQLQGTAMGASCAPSYANLFMGAWERSIFQENEVEGMKRVHNWIRFIDDILFIWEGPVNELETLMNHLNQNDRNIRLTYKYGRKIEFLDLLISASTEGHLSTTVFRKSTATNSLLHASSLHPRTTTNSIPIGQFLRIKRICSEEEQFEEQAKLLRGRFQDRGYNRRVIQRGYWRAKNTPRQHLLYKNQVSTTSKEQDNQVRFITNFSTEWDGLREIVQKHWKILFTDPILKKILPEQPSLVARRAPSLKDMLVHSTYDPKRKANKDKITNRRGFFPCGICKGCANMKKSTTFKNHDDSRTFDIRTNITCSTKGIIYHAECPCGKVYIGMTSREFKIRVREHCLDIEKAKTAIDDATLKTLPRHFKRYHQCNSRLLTFKGIDKEERMTRWETGAPGFKRDFRFPYDGVEFWRLYGTVVRYHFRSPYTGRKWSLFRGDGISSITSGRCVFYAAALRSVKHAAFPEHGNIPLIRPSKTGTGATPLEE
ncbi:unnamed protein product [Ranitomeya imitator]|uniref:Reverse transcriptase domain-containing protein n=1 Tax=Ranitomeya imitator TaxID=111125 RepID=A0ABN9KTW7_9NEOB|nr:unnamed protein product [Ranitomeya imitator]